MNSEIFSAVVLAKDQLQKILDDLSVGFITPTEESKDTSILPPFKKLGVLIDLEDIEDEETKIPIWKNVVNTKTTQSQYYSCIQCRRQLPTAHLLDLHITEQHDLYFAASVERGDKPHYTCYIEECPLKFFQPADRKDHCIKVHKFPANYRFDQGKTPNKAKIRTKKATNVMDVHNDRDVTMDLSDERVPNIKAFSFGHPTQRTFNSRKDKALIDMRAMKEALDDME
ncbi:hypothetical protein AWZ03_008623 [Drosophila navojoa]|uniref:C2H2-type domain-containing protein n=1 Tax=Drosophila navojoa TaxID=7232 RepID=A0A484B9H0_DRONA|nr:protein lethal(2)k10201 [Drosophila navojoa]TDG44942.1 hypothetical protein AWZ03_008623 [Drosophila navojoa]